MQVACGSGALVLRCRYNVILTWCETVSLWYSLSSLRVYCVLHTTTAALAVVAVLPACDPEVFRCDWERLR